MLIAVRVHPRASRARTEWNADHLEVWVTAPPVGGAANAAVLRAVADHLKVPVSAVSLKRGERGRNKLVEVSDRVVISAPAHE